MTDWLDDCSLHSHSTLMGVGTSLHLWLRKVRQGEVMDIVFTRADSEKSEVSDFSLLNNCNYLYLSNKYLVLSRKGVNVCCTLTIKIKCVEHLPPAPVCSEVDSPSQRSEMSVWEH